jgi:hypothetical protein
VFESQSRRINPVAGMVSVDWREQYKMKIGASWSEVSRKKKKVREEKKERKRNIIFIYFSFLSRISRLASI